MPGRNPGASHVAPPSPERTTPTSVAPPLKKRPTWNAPTTVAPLANVSGSTSVACWLVGFVNGSELTWVSACARAAPGAINKAATIPANAVCPRISTSTGCLPPQRRSPGRVGLIPTPVALERCRWYLHSTNWEVRDVRPSQTSPPRRSERQGLWLPRAETRAEVQFLDLLEERWERFELIDGFGVQVIAMPAGSPVPAGLPTR